MTLDEIERLAEAASPGPWRVNGRGRCVVGPLNTAGMNTGHEPVILDIAKTQADAAFIAAARAVVPDLIAELRTTDAAMED